jgi:hypothetical protein
VRVDDERGLGLHHACYSFVELLQHLLLTQEEEEETPPPSYFKSVIKCDCILVGY